jgi:hypothetical protein
MEQNTVTLIIGLAGISSTLISCGLGYYFTSKARKAPFRELLYSKQIEMICKILSRQDRFRVFATILASDDKLFHEEARNNIGNCLKEHSELIEEGEAIIPTDLWIEINKANSEMAGILSEYDNKNEIGNISIENFAAINTKVALISRLMLGVDELTDESLSLFSNKKEFEKVANIEALVFKKFAKLKNV